MQKEGKKKVGGSTSTAKKSNATRTTKKKGGGDMPNQKKSSATRTTKKKEGGTTTKKGDTSTAKKSNATRTTQEGGTTAKKGGGTTSKKGGEVETIAITQYADLLSKIKKYEEKHNQKKTLSMLSMFNNKPLDEEYFKTKKTELDGKIQKVFEDEDFQKVAKVYNSDTSKVEYQKARFWGYGTIKIDTDTFDSNKDILDLLKYIGVIKELEQHHYQNVDLSIQMKYLLSIYKNDINTLIEIETAIYYVEFKQSVYTDGFYQIEVYIDFNNENKKLRLTPVYKNNMLINKSIEIDDKNKTNILKINFRRL